jgi:hypothetical protein
MSRGTRGSRIPQDDRQVDIVDMNTYFFVRQPTPEDGNDDRNATKDGFVLSSILEWAVP